MLMLFGGREDQNSSSSKVQNVKSQENSRTPESAPVTYHTGHLNVKHDIIKLVEVCTSIFK